MSEFFSDDMPEIEELGRLQRRLQLYYSQNKNFYLRLAKEWSNGSLNDQQLEDFYKLSYRVAMDVVLAYHAVAHLNEPAPPGDPRKE